PREHLAVPLRRLRERWRGVHPPLRRRAADRGTAVPAARLRPRPPLPRLGAAVVPARAQGRRGPGLVAGGHLLRDRGLLRGRDRLGGAVHVVLPRQGVGLRPRGLPVWVLPAGG